MWPAQTSPLPDPATLKDLNPSVAITFLIVFTILAIAGFFSNSIKDRLTRSTGPAPEEKKLADAVVAHQPAASAVTAVDQAAQISAEYRDHLLDQIRELKSRVDELERENRRLREDVDRYRYQPPGWPR